jgi:hypothetical protein
MSQPAERDREEASWQRRIWDRYPEIYQREVDPRFAPVVEHVIRRAALIPGQNVLDLGNWHRGGCPAGGAPRHS